jgi:transposase
MAKTYRLYVPEQDLLLPPSLRDWLPEKHLAYFVSDLVDHLDLSAITAGYEDEERGYPPYHPVRLTKVLIYAYCVGVFSSRKIQPARVELRRDAGHDRNGDARLVRLHQHQAGRVQHDSRLPA